MKRFTVLISIFLLAASVHAENIAIVGGKIHTMGELGVIENGTVLIKNGKVESVSKEIVAPDDYTVIDAKGKVVTPGLIGAYTSLGLVEVSSSSGVVDASIGQSPITQTGAALDVSYSINPDSSLFNITRLEGMTSAATGMMGSDYMFSGQGAVISLDGKTPILKLRAFITVDVGSGGAESSGGSRASLWVMLESAIKEVEKLNTRLTPEKAWFGINSREDINALKSVIKGDTPLFMKADRAADIRQVVAFKERHPNINVVLLHGVEAWREAEAIANANIPVIIDPEYNLPGGFDQMGATLSNAARLEAAGVDVAIGMDTHNIRLATQHAGNAVANGLSYEAGLASLTRVPAQILGMQALLGQLIEGAKADVVVWSGDPLEVTESAEVVIINGEFIEMESRQTKLRDRYLKLQQGSSTTPSFYIRKE
jgi:imidazolonepropionase-like amidohydrolase